MRLPLALTLAATLAGCAQPAPPRNTFGMPTPAAAPARAPVVWTLDRATAAETREAQDAVRAVLRDPESARFRSIIALKGSNGRRSICGLVNSRNGFGGYVGDTAFYWSQGSAPMLASERRFATLFPGICQERTIS